MESNMIEYKNMETQAFLKQGIQELNMRDGFYTFSTFLTEHWLEPEEVAAYHEVTEVPEQAKFREKAYRRCYKAVQSTGVVSRPTLRQWFGVGKAEKNSKPRRSQLIEFAFAARLTEQELQEYLVEGMLEPGIQYNDYTEVIYQYGLHNQLSYSECNDMIVVFEKEVNKQNVIAQNTHTEELVREYRRHQDVSKEEFLVWMCKKASYFKGYSKVALNWFVSLKHEILDYIREKIGIELQDDLQDVGYTKWRRENKKSDETELESILRFVHNMTRQKNNDNNSERYRSIANDAWIVHGTKDRNSDLLGELYAAAVDVNEMAKLRRHRFRSRNLFQLPESMYFMTDKYLSQLIGIAGNKEREIRLSQAFHDLENEDPKAQCPEWIYDSLQKYGLLKKEMTVAVALKEINKELKKQKQACRYIRRSDLLPFIHYVAQHRYYKQYADYDKQDAQIYFEQLANEVFGECHMAPLNPKYELDSMYLLTFGEHDMYSLSELIGATDLEWDDNEG